jgi:NAD(P)-dependent dehydrogenase (short-subunit alcohol dehydrogenase family)
MPDDAAGFKETDMQKLAGKVAIITGASRGIGQQIAELFAAEGAKVVCAARTLKEGEHRMLEGSLSRTLDLIRGKGGEATPVTADVSAESECIALVEAARNAYGPIDILVNNAAITYFMPVVDFPEKRFKLMMEVQVYAPFHLSQLVLPSMKERHTGWIVNISSGAGIHPKPPYQAAAGRGGTVYGMCKAALERFTTGLASEVAGDGVAVNVVSPGLVETPGTLLHNLVNDTTRSRVQPIEYIAEEVFQLASCDPRETTGRIEYAAPFLKELNREPAALV